MKKMTELIFLMTLKTLQSKRLCRNTSFLKYKEIIDLALYLKLQSVGLASLSPSLFENLELQLLAELSCLRGVVLWHGFSADESAPQH